MHDSWSIAFSATKLRIIFSFQHKNTAKIYIRLKKASSEQQSKVLCPKKLKGYKFVCLST